MNTLKIKITSEAIKGLWNTDRINAITKALENVRHEFLDEENIEINLEIVDDGVEYESIEKAEKEQHSS